MTKLQNVTFKKKTGILLKTYRRRIHGAKSFMKTSYPDEALLLILTTALNKDNEYRSTIDSLASLDDLSVEQKAKALQEKEHRLRESTPTATNAERANAARQRQRQRAPRTKQQDSNASDYKPELRVISYLALSCLHSLAEVSLESANIASFDPNPFMMMGSAFASSFSHCSFFSSSHKPSRREMPSVMASPAASCEEEDPPGVGEGGVG
ncbi:hypothetical protein E4U60_006337 [Claviceps pazoutovae]|uniref:Uncharacterized protein n=1 Tax=Claviceps pazoutovae TaxID=1649127 RepID=A0A9P7SEE9_9HYPO|nr:hypothetical protein E4U60_006337 [Claviceps pazoutovae]